MTVGNWGLYTVKWHTWSKVWVCSCLLAGNVSSNLTRSMDVCLVSILCCQVEVSSSGRSLIQSSPTDCGVSNECNCEAPKGEAITRNQIEVQKKKMVQWSANNEPTRMWKEAVVSHCEVGIALSPASWDWKIPCEILIRIACVLACIQTEHLLNTRHECSYRRHPG
jgi:hypothetical protein